LTVNFSLPLVLAKVFLKMHLRDRQAIVFSLFFPILFMLVLGFISGERDPVELGVVNSSGSALAEEFIETLAGNPIFNVTEGEEETLRAALVEGETTMVLVLPEQFEKHAGSSELRLLVDAAQVRQLGILMPVLEKALVGVERQLRNTEPMFSLRIEDVKARSQSYLDFLLPGLLAFTLMQISLAGSGFNIVEYRRKGILKRLFVTPIRPRDFILGLVAARLLLCILQLSLLLGIAVFFLDVTIIGDFASLYSVIILGSVIFLSLGFTLGSLAKTQQAIMAIGNVFIFPQMFLSGIFFPIDTLPELIQPIASVLPLTFVANALREIATNGAVVFELMPDLLGLGLWLMIGLLAATRLFVWKEVAS
jgi:ABC-2 type transport system permease protein